MALPACLLPLRSPMEKCQYMWQREDVHADGIVGRKTGGLTSQKIFALFETLSFEFLLLSSWCQNCQSLIARIDREVTTPASSQDSCLSEGLAGKLLILDHNIHVLPQHAASRRAAASPQYLSPKRADR